MDKKVARIFEYLKEKYNSDRYFYQITALVLMMFVMINMAKQEETEFELPITKVADETDSKRQVSFAVTLGLISQREVEPPIIKVVDETDSLIEKIDLRIFEIEQQQEKILRVIDRLEKIEKLNQQNLKIIEKLEKMEAFRK